MDIKIKIIESMDGYSVKLSAPDREAFGFAIQTLKEIVPATLRSYTPAEKIWVINDWDYLNMWLAELNASFTVGVVWERESSRAPPPTQSIASPFQTLHLLPDAPPELVKAAYKTLAKIHHPDARGDSEKMVAINRAFEIITQNK
jgi:hypothetical protein